MTTRNEVAMTTRNVAPVAVIGVGSLVAAPVARAQID